MKRRCVALALLFPAVSWADQPTSTHAPKQVPGLPPKVQEIASQLFREAAAAAAKHEYLEAVLKYRELQALAHHPNINFNIAMLYEDEGDYDRAIKEYELYLPAASERELPELTAKLAKLANTPAELIGVASTKYNVKSIWILDGVLQCRDACKMYPLAGAHRLENISELGYRTMRVRTKAGPKGATRIEWNVDTRTDGNLVVSSPVSDNWTWALAIDGSDRDDALGKDVHYSGRYQVAPGKHTLSARDTICRYDLEFTIKKDQILYWGLVREGYDETAVAYDGGPTQPACGRIVSKPIAVNFDAKLPAPVPRQGSNPAPRKTKK